ncbi:hypothetical protein GGS23DRAFT_593745 [Durotheca rogersii]|uniref:uncharacterized protein n=1 Tax=Durotheca rogersii TaxID=419775 RepID=UPI00221F3DE6|nr:uncharacterized protein GGS23DRAFT_593745 [Durotheca rogersii]KAI5867015.1 hypothetical protein GGS23DRAFT_593745 [Durotheca rogersii]
MAAKISLPADETRALRTRARRRFRPLLTISLVALALYALCAVLPFSPSYGPFFGREGQQSSLSSENSDVLASPAGKLVPLEAHIMSKCPDAKDCLKDLVLPTMMRISDKVNFTLSYIGRPTENDGIECRHGPNECMGNIIELCAHHLYPDPKIYLGFTMCLTRDYKLIPQRELVEDCALEHAIDFDKINECATRDDGAFGLALLRDSVKRTEDVCRGYQELHSPT